MPSLNRLFARLTSRAVCAKSKVNTPKKLFELAGALFSAEAQASDPTLPQILLAQREKLGSTALGNGIALPHAVMKTTDSIRISVITLSEGIAFDAPDGEPVDIFFCLILPEHNSQNDNETMVQQITKMLKNHSLIDAIRDSQNNQELYQSLLMVMVPEDA